MTMQEAYEVLRHAVITVVESHNDPETTEYLKEMLELSEGAVRAESRRPTEKQLQLWLGETLYNTKYVPSSMKLVKRDDLIRKFLLHSGGGK